MKVKNSFPTSRMMRLDKLRAKCCEIHGIAKVRKASFHTFTDFVALDAEEADLARTRAEYERFFT